MLRNKTKAGCSGINIFAIGLFIDSRGVTSLQQQQF